jgi:hypothetical protein
MDDGVVLVAVDWFILAPPNYLQSFHSMPVNNKPTTECTLQSNFI